MDWRNKNSEGGTKPQSNFKQKSKNNERSNTENSVFKNKKINGRFKNDTDSDEKRQTPKYNNQRSNGRFDNRRSRFQNENSDETDVKSDEHNSGIFKKSSKTKKYNNNNQPKQKTFYKSHEEIDKILNSGKYIPANKRSQLESLREKLKAEYDKEHPDISNESMFPSLSSTVVETEKPKTCWGQKLPSQIYDGTVQFTRQKTSSSKPVTKVNSDISDDHEYDSFDDEDDYYNEYDDEDEYYDEGY